MVSSSLGSPHSAAAEAGFAVSIVEMLVVLRALKTADAHRRLKAAGVKMIKASSIKDHLDESTLTIAHRRGKDAGCEQDALGGT